MWNLLELDSIAFVQINNFWLGAQIFQQPHSTIAPRELRYFALRIGDISKIHCLGFASLNARRNYISVANLASLIFCLVFAFSNSLDAEGAFLHHAATANRYFRIQS